MASTVNYSVNVSTQFVNQPYGGNKSVSTSSFGDQAVQETTPVYGNANLNLIPAGFTNMIVGLFINDNSSLSSSVIFISGSDGKNPLGATLYPGAAAVIPGSGLTPVSIYATVSGSTTGTASLQYTIIPA